MIVAKVTVEDKGSLWLKKFAKRLEGFEKAYVTIGVHDDTGTYEGSDVTVAEVAMFNEFGTTGRGPGHENTAGPAFANGAVPERSFIRSTIDENEALINSWRTEMIEKVIAGDWDVEKALDAIGFRIKTLIQNKIESNVPPPNAPSTLDQKRRDGVPPNTLMNTKLLWRSINYKVVVR